MKKKQADFQKTKLRVGRQLPKGQNVTDTSFQTGKISVPDQSKPASKEVSLKELLKHLNYGEVSKKKDYLQKLNNYVLKEKDSLPLNFLDILTKLGNPLLENDQDVRTLALAVLHTCFMVLSDTQVNCFFTSLTSHLNCMMTHINKSVRKDSLKFLDEILETHPMVICPAVNILNNMLNMISTFQSEPTRKRKLDEYISSQMTSQEWRIEVLKRVQSFLERMLEEDKIEDQTEREVHWDGEKPLYLPLYTHGGLKPVKLQTSLNNSLKDQKSVQTFKAFMYEFIPILSQILIGETRYKRCVPFYGKDKKPMAATLVDIQTAKLLNVGAQILCSLGEIILKSRTLTDESDGDLKIFLGNVIGDNLLPYFPFVKQDSSYTSIKNRNKERSSKTDEVQCMQLNLAICYAYAMFVIDTEKVQPRVQDHIMSYLKDVFAICSKMCSKSISYTLKFSPILMKSASLNEDYKNVILLGLYGILELAQHDPITYPIYEFFMDISLNYEYQCLLKMDGMEAWFRLVMKEIIYMLESDNIDKKFLKYVRILCARKYEYFMGIVNGIQPEECIGLLKHNDEEFQFTVIHLICAKDIITEAFFKQLCETLCSTSFSVKTASRLIHFLQARFSNAKKIQDQAHFVQFLLNVAFDTTIIADSSVLESNHPCNDLMEFMLGCHYEVIPFEEWKRHLKIADICIDYLSSYLHYENLTHCILVFFKELFVNGGKMPVHSALSLLKLRNKIRYLYDVRDIDVCFLEVIFSCLMYMSFLMVNKMDDQEIYAFSELQKNMSIERRDMRSIMNVINSVILNYGENELYHVLRIILFLIKMNVLIVNDGHLVSSLLEKINDKCQRSDRLRPLYANALKFFRFI